jgi:glutamate N-acetyltransferase / amino-acid N-acetyltransferase
MAVGLSAPETILSIEGVRLASCYCGIKKKSSLDDLVLIEINETANVAAVFTTNKFCAAPVTVAKKHLQSGSKIRYLLINSGNANAGTGDQGIATAEKSCEVIAQATGLKSDQVLPFSTGVIGQQLEVSKIEDAVPELLAKLDQENWMQAVKGIMTTDTLPKAISRQVTIDGKVVTISGMCKGSGMIKPDMATMLAYVATDAEIDSDTLSVLLKQAVDQSFNAITVDGDTSTNDACVLIASGVSGVKVDANQLSFIEALNDVFKILAQSIIRDGEGATKFIEIAVNSAASTKDARELAYTIAHSPLVKTALFASDANWGRILAAIGRAPVDTLSIDKVDLYIGNTCLVRGGEPDPEYTEAKGQMEMSQQDIVIRVDLNVGSNAVQIWTTDLSFEYVKINAEYRS